MVGLEGISAQALSDVIGAVYDCALDPRRWADTCQAVADLCNSTGGGICVHDLRHVHNDQLFVFGYQPDFLAALGSQFADSPMAVSDIVANLGDVSALSMERFHLRDSRFYREVLQPFGLHDMVWFPALRTGGRTASMHASRSDGTPPYQSREIQLFKLLAPHVCRALAISDVLDIAALRSEILETTLDGLAAGVYLMARDGHVVYMNRAAERQVGLGRALRLVNNRISATDSTARAALSQAVDAAARHDSDAPVDAHFGQHSIAIPDGFGGGYVATLLPIGGARRRDILAPFAASVAVFIQDPIHAPLMPGEAFARLHGLTGGELRVLLAVAQGLGGVEAADMLQVSEPTIRTHLQRIFSKTGTSKQADLLRLLHNSAPPTRGPQTPPH